MDRILSNEINRLIGRFPEEKELKSAKKYIEYNADDNTGANELRGLVVAWVDECMAECTNCGKWHLREDMVDYYCDLYCDEDCVELYAEKTYDMHAEARAEYVCSNR